MIDTPLLNHIELLGRDLVNLPMALFLGRKTPEKRIVEDFEFLNDTNLVQVGGMALFDELKEYYRSCDTEKTRLMNRLLRTNLTDFKKVRNEIADYQNIYHDKLKGTSYHRASINGRSKADLLKAQSFKDEEYGILKDNLNMIRDALTMLDGWIGAIERNLANTEPTLLQLNRVLAEMPGKLNSLFSGVDIQLQERWDTLKRLQTEEYEAVVRRYRHLNLIDDINLIETIQLNHDFEYELKNRTDKLSVVSDLLTKVHTLNSCITNCLKYLSDVDADQPIVFNVTSGIAELNNWLIDLINLLNSCLRPQNYQQDFELLQNDTAYQLFQAHIREFKTLYAEISVDAIDGRLNKINEFIDEALHDKSDIDTAFSISSVSNERFSVSNRKIKSNCHYEYLRLTYGFYQSNWCEGRVHGTLASRVYAKCFLFKDWLEEQKKNLIMATLTPPANDTQQSQASSAYNDDQKRSYVRSILAPLSGLNPSKQAIISRVDFERLITYTDYLVFNNTLPAEISTIAQTGISNEHVRYTFYRLHKELFGTRQIRPAFIDFLHAVFTQFSGTAKTTTKSKFSTPPKSYENDFTGYIGETV